jgi:hypothetical protein
MAAPRRNDDISEDEDAEKGDDNISEMSEDEGPEKGDDNISDMLEDEDETLAQPPPQTKSTSQPRPQHIRKDQRRTSLYNILHPDSDDDDNHGLGSGGSLLDSDDDGMADWRRELGSHDGD